MTLVAQPIAPQEVGGVRLEITECSKAAAAITCNVMVSSIGKDQDVTFHMSSRCVDTAGVLYSWKGYKGPGEKQTETSGPRRWFVADVRVAAQMTFEAQTDQPSKALAVCQIDFQPDGGPSTKALFRNLPLK